VYERRGRWYYTVDIKDPATGKWRKVWSHAFDRQADAWTARVEALDRVHHGRFADPGRITVGEYLERWQKSRPVGFGVRVTTANTYGYQVAWMLPHIGQVLLRDLAPDQIRAMYRTLLESGGRGGRPLAVATVRGVHTALHKAMEDAVADDLIWRNPMDRVRRPTAVSTRDLTVWDADQAIRFLSAVDGDRLAPMWLLFLTTGMRRGEVVGLRWKDVNLQTGQIAVRHQLTSMNGKVVSSDPKTSSSRATVAIDEVVVESLRRHRASQREERLFIGPAWQDSGYVFVWPDGSPYNPEYLTRLFGRLIARAGLPVIRLHDLRHTCATLLLEAGVPMKVVQERLRHSSYSTTADIYASVTAGMQHDAARTITTLLAPKGDRATS